MVISQPYHLYPNGVTAAKLLFAGFLEIGKSVPEWQLWAYTPGWRQKFSAQLQTTNVSSEFKVSPSAWIALLLTIYL